MNLTEKINEDLKNSMKSGDKLRTTTLRSIRALILEFEKSGQNRAIAPEDEIKMLIPAAEKRKESIEQFRNAGREELAMQEEAELKIIQEYLPAQISEEELYFKIKKMAEETGATDKTHFAKLMPKAAAEFKGKADGKIIKTIVEKVLSIG